MRLGMLDLRGKSLRHHANLAVPAQLLDEASLRLRPGLALLQLSWHPRTPLLTTWAAKSHSYSASLAHRAFFMAWDRGKAFRGLALLQLFSGMVKVCSVWMPGCAGMQESHAWSPSARPDSMLGRRIPLFQARDQGGRQLRGSCM